MDSIGSMFASGGDSGGGWMSMIPTALNVVGQGQKYSGQQQVAAGQDAQAGAYEEIGQRRAYVSEIQAQQYEANAQQQVASSQRTAEETRRQSRITASRALAVAAASGGGASDPTVVKIISQIAGEGSYRSMTNLYDGEVAARTSLAKAQAERYGGSIAQLDAERAAGALRGQASNTRSNANINALTGIGKSLYDKYGKDTDPGTNPNYTPYGESSPYNNAFDTPSNYG